MIKLEIKITTNKLADIYPALHTATTAAIENFLTDVKNDAKSRAPRRTDYLYDHIEKNDISLFEGEVVSGAPYSLFVERGTRKMSARPFLQPAFEAHKNDPQKTIEQGLKLLLK